MKFLSSRAKVPEHVVLYLSFVVQMRNALAHVGLHKNYVCGSFCSQLFQARPLLGMGRNACAIICTLCNWGNQCESQDEIFIHSHDQS